MSKVMRGLALSAATALLGTAAQAACDPGKAGIDLTGEEAQAVYECLAEELQAGYQTGTKRWVPAAHVNDYPGWTKASTIPAAPGFHGGRFLVTYVNEIGAEMYLQYAEDPVVPVGTVLAKESFWVTDDGKVEKGPLFLMEKVDADTSPETDDWYYYLVAANGRPQAVNVVVDCSECHQGNFPHQGGMGYPVDEARVTN